MVRLRALMALQAVRLITNPPITVQMDSRPLLKHL
jgi:hypothetical protein